MKQYIEQLKYRTPRIPLPELTEEERALQANGGRSGGYEGRLRSLFLNENSTSGYMAFGGSPARASNASTRPGQPNRPTATPDPKLTLDYAFKVRLFWIAARANNCQYCLGHQESKLLAAGMTEDEIASLDCNWESFPRTNKPHLHWHFG